MDTLISPSQTLTELQRILKEYCESLNLHSNGSHCKLIISTNGWRSASRFDRATNTNTVKSNINKNRILSHQLNHFCLSLIQKCDDLHSAHRRKRIQGIIT